MTRERIILTLLTRGSKNTIEKFNRLTSMTDRDLEREYKQLTN